MNMATCDFKKKNLPLNMAIDSGLAVNKDHE
jgi:hypothetical protein